jgi:hypothetical protein
MSGMSEDHPVQEIAENHADSDECDSQAGNSDTKIKSENTNNPNHHAAQ